MKYCKKIEEGNSIKLFEDKVIRSSWNEEEEEWYFRWWI